MQRNIYINKALQANTLLRPSSQQSHHHQRNNSTKTTTNRPESALQQQQQHRIPRMRHPRLNELEFHFSDFPNQESTDIDQRKSLDFSEAFVLPSSARRRKLTTDPPCFTATDADRNTLYNSLLNPSQQGFNTINRSYTAMSNNNNNNSSEFSSNHENNSQIMKSQNNNQINKNNSRKNPLRLPINDLYFAINEEPILFVPPSPLQRTPSRSRRYQQAESNEMQVKTSSQFEEFLSPSKSFRRSSSSKKSNKRKSKSRQKSRSPLREKDTSAQKYAKEEQRAALDTTEIISATKLNSMNPQFNSQKHFTDMNTMPTVGFTSTTPNNSQGKVQIRLPSWIQYAPTTPNTQMLSPTQINANQKHLNKLSLPRYLNHINMRQDFAYLRCDCTASTQPESQQPFPQKESPERNFYHKTDQCESNFYQNSFAIQL